MPRGRETLAIELSSLCHAVREKRRAAREPERMDDMRRKTYGWLELRQQTEGLEIQADMAEMELRMVNADRRIIGLPPIKTLPSNGGLGDTRRPEDDWRNYED